jgi:hypothetical protein
MFTLLGSKPTELCDGLTRRDFLHIGALGAAGITGLGLPSLLQAQPLAGDKRFGKAKSCILIFMLGAPPQHETFDPKPDAPEEIGGAFKPIATNVPGLRICEHLPLLARRANQYTIIRSVRNDAPISNNHKDAVYLSLTGHRKPQIIEDIPTNGAKPEDYPCVGSAVSCLRPVGGAIPAHVCLGEFPRKPFGWGGPGAGAGFLGKRYDPFLMLKTLDDAQALDFPVPALTAPADVSLERLEQRRDILDAVNRQADRFRHSEAGARLDASFQKAFDLASSALAGKAFNLSAEAASLRDRYRRHLFGQGLLLARRLIEHGVRLATVLFHGNDFEQGWDLHSNGFAKCKVLLPIFDQGLSALLDDMADRGLLEETLVVCMGEFGRTPRVGKDGSRDHWGNCYSLLMAGAGIPGGRVYGSSDSNGAYPRDNPVNTSDVVATIYHCLGIAPETELTDPFGRPLRLCQGTPIRFA